MSVARTCTVYGKSILSNADALAGSPSATGVQACGIRSGVRVTVTFSLNWPVMAMVPPALYEPLAVVAETPETVAAVVTLAEHTSALQSHSDLVCRILLEEL